MVLDEELLDEIKQDIGQRSRVPGENFFSTPEDEHWSGEYGEDDDMMKLVIWKFYQRQGSLDAAVLETHEGLRDELDAIDWISPQLLEVTAKTFIKRRAEMRSRRG